MELLYIFGIPVLLIAIWVLADRSKLQRLRRQRQREHLPRERFIEAFNDLGIPENLPGTVYDYYTSQQAWKDFPFSPDDKYSAILCDDPLDMEDDSRALVGRLGMHFLPGYILSQWEKPIETLRDMVLWLDWVRQHQPSRVANATSQKKMMNN